MRKRWFACATILILCCSLSSEINTTYGEKLLNLCRPVGAQYPISQPFGPSTDRKLQEAYKNWGYNGHFGVDYACPVGTDIFACDDGEVFEANNSNPKHPNGLYLRIKHKWGSSVYCHLSSVAVLNGKRVAKNSVLGSSGKTGYVTGAHLHFGLRISGISNPGYKDYIDPQKYASFESPVTQLPTSQTKEQKKSPEVVTLPEYSKETLLLRERIKVYKSKLLSVSSKLLRNIPNPPSIEFKLTASEKVNAWADGRITMGLMDFLYSNPAGNPDDQLAMIMAHIVAHKKLDTETVKKMLEVGLESSKATYNDIINGVSYAVSAVLPTPPVWLASTVLGEGSKEIVDWITKKTLKTFQRDQENTSHFFGILYVSKAGFDTNEGLKFFNNPSAFSKQHPIDRQFWEDYAKEVQAKLDNERQLAAKALTEQKKSPEVAKLLEYPQETIPPNKVTIEDGLIKQKGSYKIYLLLDGKKYFIPDRTTLNSLNFGGQSVRALTSNVFNSIPEGNSVEAKEIFALRKKGKLLTTQKVQKLPSADQRVFGSRVQKVGEKVQKLPSTKDFKIPHIYTKTAKNIEKPSAKSNFILPDVYNRSKSYSSLNVPSSSLDSLYQTRYRLHKEEAQDVWDRNEEMVIEILKMPNRKKGQSYTDALGSLSPRERKYWERTLKLARLEKQIMKQEELKNQRYRSTYNQNIPYQTTPMITNQSKEKSAGYATGLEMITKKDKEKNTGYADGLDMIKNYSTSNFNTQFRTEGVRKVLGAFERWLADYYMEKTKRLAANKKYFTAVNAMNLKGKGIDKVWDSILYAADNNDIVGLEKSIEIYKDLIKSELSIIKNQK